MIYIFHIKKREKFFTNVRKMKFSHLTETDYKLKVPVENDRWTSQELIKKIIIIKKNKNP